MPFKPATESRFIIENQLVPLTPHSHPIKLATMSFQSSSDQFSKAPGSYNSGQQSFINPQPSVGRFPIEVPTFYHKRSSDNTIGPSIAKSMAPQGNQGNLLDDQSLPEKSPASSSRNPHRFHGPRAQVWSLLAFLTSNLVSHRFAINSSVSLDFFTKILAYSMLDYMHKFCGHLTGLGMCYRP